MTPSGCPTVSQYPQLEEADIRPKKADFSFCEGFRMPAGSNRATDASGRRTKTSKGRNRDLGALGGPRRATCSAMGI